MGNQFRDSARNHDLRSLGSLFDSNDHAASALAGREGLQPRLLLARHAALGLAQINDHVLTFGTLHRGVDHFAYATDVLVVNRVAFSLAHLLKDHLLGQLRRDSTQNIGGLVRAQLAANLCRRIGPPSLVERNLRNRIFDCLRIVHDGANGVGPDLAALFVEFSPQILLRLVILAGGYNDGILHRAHDDLRIDTFLATESVDYVVQFTRHKFSPP